jgi:tRNA threonylcarbamoyl adenosine modification protein (Sua5/YciO/YrdC/YwlC family)
MRIRIHPENPQARLISQAVDALKQDGVLIIPTDSVYALACALESKKAYEQMCRIKGVKPEKALFSLLCPDLKTVGEYAIHISTPTFKVLKRALPGPYTFILEASKLVPKTFQTKRRTIGVRVPDHPICKDLMAALGTPLVVTSLNKEDDIIDHMADPDEIWDRYEKVVDAFVDGGYGGLFPSTVIDCSNGDDQIEVVREGLGPVDFL